MAVNILSIGVFVITHESVHAMLCFEYGGKPTVDLFAFLHPVEGMTGFSFALATTSCEIEEETSEQRFLDGLNEVIGYNLVIVIVLFLIGMNLYFWRRDYE
jgi:hypothetical protein